LIGHNDLGCYFFGRQFGMTGGPTNATNGQPDNE
jgi:hypothetical protein